MNSTCRAFWHSPERILPQASNIWVQASLDYRQRLQALFFPEGITYQTEFDSIEPP